MPDAANEAGLHEYIDAEMTVAGLETPAQQTTLRELLSKMQGVQSVSIFGGKLAINYEPVFVSEKQLAAAVRGAGFQVSDEHLTPSSAMTDAFVPHSHDHRA